MKVLLWKYYYIISPIVKFSIYIITMIVLYHEWYYYENIR